MDDKELADKVVALGVGTFNWPDLEPVGYYFIDGEPLDDDQYVRDWRVAGALTERLPQGVSVGERAEQDGIWTAFVYGRSEDATQHESAPRAIIEACVQALRTENTTND